MITSMEMTDVVSNPLGWDGDFSAKKIALIRIRVSNPLGWDGDVSVHFEVLAM